MIDVSLPSFPHMFACSLTRAYWFHQSNDLHLLNVSFRTKISTSFLKNSASKGCRDKCDNSCFKILDHASTYSQLKIKESFHIE